MISDFFEKSYQDAINDEAWWDRRRGCGYMDFYMGIHWVGSRADLTPVYELIFRRLQTHGADWRYAFPRIHIIDFGPKEADPDAPYDPSAALEQQAEQKTRAEETARMRMQLDRDVLAAKRKARTAPPPATVRAYQKIFQRFPQGWPPDPYTTA